MPDKDYYVGWLFGIMTGTLFGLILAMLLYNWGFLYVG